MKKHTIGCWVAIGVVIIVLVVSGRYLFSRNERTILTDTLVQQISSSGDTKDLTAEPLRLEAEGVVKDTGNNDILFIDHKFYTNSTQIEVKPYAMEDSDVIKVFLYDSDTHYVMQENLLSKGNEKIVFSNLTASKTYYLAFTFYDFDKKLFVVDLSA